MLTFGDAARLMSEQRGYLVSREQAAVAFVSVDQSAIEDECARRVWWEMLDWDSTVNGRPAEIVKARPDYGGAEAYLIFVDEALVFLQPHDPFEAGFAPITKANMAKIASRHCDKVVDEMIQAETVARLVEALPEDPPVPVVTDSRITPSSMSHLNMQRFQSPSG